MYALKRIFDHGVKINPGLVKMDVANMIEPLQSAAKQKRWQNWNTGDENEYKLMN